MKTKIYIFLLLCFCTTLTSEASLTSQQGEIENHAVVTHTSGTKLQKVKLNFFQKLVLTITGRKKERAETSNDDGLANASVICGIAGLLFLSSIAVGGGVAALLSILTGLLDAETGENESVLEWNRDPEEFDFRFIRDGENMTVEIREYADGERQPDSGELMFSHTGDRREVCNAFAETFEQLYADRDTDEFEFNWRQPFPFAEYATFQEAMNRLQ